MPGWEKVKLKINDYEAVDHKKAYLKENMPLKSKREGRLCPRLDRLQLYRRHIGKRAGPGDEETKEKRRALGTRMVSPSSLWTCTLRRGGGVELSVFTGCRRQNYQSLVCRLKE